MSFSRTCRGGVTLHSDYGSSISRNNDNQHNISNANYFHGLSRNSGDYIYNVRNDEDVNPLKRRKFSGSEDSRRHYRHPNTIGNAPSTSNSSYTTSARSDVDSYPRTGSKRDRSTVEEEVVFFSREEIEKMSPSRKDGIDSFRENYLRYSYCVFLQNLGLRLDLPQTTIGTAMVLCHRFFVRRSHACHDRFMIATAALFLAAKSEETPCPLNSVLKASYEICYKQDLNLFPYLLPIDWFEQYRERVTDAEQMILTTLDFELNVQHPYVPLKSVLNKLGLSQTLLVNLALNLVSEGDNALVQNWVLEVMHCFKDITIIATVFGTLASILSEDSPKFFPPDGCFHSWLRSSLWLQFKPHHIAAGAAFLAAQFLNFDLASYQTALQEFQTTPSILEDVIQQLMELF